MSAVDDLREYYVLADANAKPDAREALIAQSIAFVAFARANPALFRLMFGHRYGGADTDAVWRTYKILSDRVASLLPPEKVRADRARS